MAEDPSKAKVVDDTGTAILRPKKSYAVTDCVVD